MTQNEKRKLTMKVLKMHKNLNLDNYDEYMVNFKVYHPQTGPQPYVLRHQAWPLSVT